MVIIVLDLADRRAEHDHVHHPGSQSTARRCERASRARRTRRSGARPLVGYPDLWRIRVAYYRVIYTVNGAELLVLALRVAHRSSVYRDL